MRKLQQMDRMELRKGQASEDEQKIAMWLPSFSPQDGTPGQPMPYRQDSAIQSPVVSSTKDSRLQSVQLSHEFNN